MDIKIPESNDLEWQQQMLRRLAESLEELQSGFEERKEAALNEAVQIVTALQEYSGF